MVRGIVPEFYRRKPFAPLLGSAVNCTAEIHLRTLIDALHWPSVCGWYAIEYSSLVLAAARISRHITLVKTLSLSETMEWGTPCSLMTFSQKARATYAALKGWQSGTKCAYLVSLSMTTMIASYPSDFGSPLTKSMVKSCHGSCGMGKG